MKIPWRLVRRLIAGAALIVVIAGFSAPYIDAGAFRARIQSALEKSLGREVRIAGAVHYSLFSGPGFEMDDVLISDDPQAGIEPFMHVGRLTARLELASLFGRKIAFSSLRLDDPDVNLVRPASGSWNIQAFVARMAAGNQGSRTDVPDIEVRSARLNFKFGDTKSVFYIRDADLDVYARSAGELVVKFEGEPARTDRGAQGFGNISCRGTVREIGGHDELSLAVGVQRTSIIELSRLFGAGDSGVHGEVIVDAHLTGPVAKPAIQGTVTVADVRRSDLTSAAGERWDVPFRGSMDLKSQEMEFTTSAAEGQPAPMQAAFRLNDYLSTPRWSMTASFTDLAAESLAGVARHMGFPLPEQMTVQGAVSGSLAWAHPGELDGALMLVNSSVTVPSVGSARLDTAKIAIGGGRVTFGPATVSLDDGQSADISAAWDGAARAVTVSIDTKAVALRELRAASSALLQGSVPPLLDAARGGTAAGSLRYEQKGDAAGTWSGEYTLRDAQLEIEGLAGPLRVTTAGIRTGADGVSITGLRARAGKIEVAADYHAAGSPAAADHIRIALGDTDAAELERLLTPTLRRPETLLTRLRLRRSVAPEWLRTRNLEGAVQVRSLLARGENLGSFKARLRWNGTAVALRDITWNLDEASGTGALAASLTGAGPQYRLSGAVLDLPWREGSLDVNGNLTAAGTGLGLLASAHMEGAFAARDVLLAPDAAFDEVSGHYVFRADALPDLVIDRVLARQDRETFTGQGASQPDGRIALELVSGRRQLRYLAAGLGLPAAPESR